MIKWIVFDVDGTLIETALSNILGLQETMMDLYGQKYSKEELRRLMGIPGDEALRKIGVKDDKIISTWRQWSDNVKKYSNYNYFFDGIKEMLLELEKNYCLGIVTSKTYSQLKEDLQESSLLESFKAFICKEDTEKHKPNPEPLIKFMNNNGINREEIIYIGDALVDYEAACAAGIKFAHCRYSEKTDNINCEIIFSKPIEIVKYFT
ncbi:HAD-superfamily hydrolase, subfamily IA, variant 1 [Clostridium sp. DL-VIII]|uniref:HAD family hydrolase n=1 Tax=Clostridium sp. DL-VIII TaxID=641107 RepID=UPI00023AF89B|nr:HAD family hydrolase [Clostridium sp. DL-VIII]EHI96921.1 HAD-superfamily hydrolase, subfamily IA, variant 1 [Clostridium sp. DL-VIII]